MAACPKCGKHIVSRYGVKKCKRHGFLESSRKEEEPNLLTKEKLDVQTEER